jgi:hypothetical protein
MTLKEHLHVFIGNTFPALLPERTFVRYVPMAEVVDHYKRVLGSEPLQYTYHQMPQMKSLTKALNTAGYEGSALEEVYAWELKHASTLAALPLCTREKLFPTVAVWGKKA